MAIRAEDVVYVMTNEHGRWLMDAPLRVIANVCHLHDMVVWRIVTETENGGACQLFASSRSTYPDNCTSLVLTRKGSATQTVTQTTLAGNERLTGPLPNG